MPRLTDKPLNSVKTLRFKPGQQISYPSSYILAAYAKQETEPTVPDLEFEKTDAPSEVSLIGGQGRSANELNTLTVTIANLILLSLIAVISAWLIYYILN